MNLSVISKGFYLNCVCIYFPKLFNQPTSSLIRKYIYKSLPLRNGLQYMNLNSCVTYGTLENMQ